MYSRLAQFFALFVAAASSLHAGTVTFTYAAANVGSTAVSGFGSFSYNGSLASIAEGNLTSFSPIRAAFPSLPPSTTLWGTC